MALGVPPRALARRPFLLSAQIAVAGVALGVPVGLAADAWLASVMDQFFPLRSCGRASRRTSTCAARRSGSRCHCSPPRCRSGVRCALPRSRRSESGARRAQQRPRVACAGRARARGRAGQPPTAQRPAHAAPHADDAPWDRGGRDDRDRARRGHGPHATLAASRREALAGSPQRLTVDLVSPQSPRSTSVRGIAGASSVGRSQTSLRLASTLASGPRRIECRSRRSATNARSGIRRSATARCQPCNPGWSSRGARRSTCTYRSATASAWCIRSRLDRRPSGLPRRRCP